MAFQFTVNGSAVSVDAPAVTPQLWVIREELKLTGTKFGCGVGLCGACVVHVDGKRAFSCQTQVSNVAGKEVTTIEGLSPASASANFAMTVAGRVWRDRKNAGAALLAAIRAAIGERAQSKLRLAEFRGFPIRFEPETSYASGKVVYDVVLARAGYHQETRINLGFTPERAIATLDEMLAGFEAEIAVQRQRIADETRRLQEFEARIGQEFPLAGELTLKLDELTAIETDLAATKASETADQSPAVLPTATLEAA